MKLTFASFMVNTYNHNGDTQKRGLKTKSLTRFLSIGALFFVFPDASENPKPHVSAIETRADVSGPGLEKARFITETANFRRLTSRLQMESRFRDLDLRFDSLWADTLLVPMPKRKQFLKSLHTASRVRDSAKVHLLELRLLGEESNPAKWESIRKKTKRSLDGLNRFFLDAESILQVDLEGKKPIPAVQG